MIAPLGSSTLDQTLLPNGRKAPSHMLREPPANSLAAGNRQGHDEVLSPTMPAVKLPSSGDGYSPNPITSASTVAVDHPRPQRSVDFPALVSFSRSSNTPTHSDHQPFHQQYPSYPPNHLAGQPGPYFYPPLPSQPIPMTGMHHIPQEAVHASAFHTAASQQPNPGPYYSPSAAYFYPMTEPNFMVPDPHLTQPFVEHNNFYVATPAMPVAAENPPITQAPRNVVAREMNGMVYYSDPAPADSSQESAVPKAATLDVEEAIPPEIAPGMVYFSHQNAGMDPYHYPAFYPTMHPLQMGDMKQDS